MPRRLRALVVDDYPALVRSVSRLLARDCDVVGSVEDFNGLLETVQRLKPDLLVLDVNLPNVDGLVACHQVTQGSPGTKVIVYTAADDPDLERRAFEAGASAFVHKLHHGGLLAAVRRLTAET